MPRPLSARLADQFKADLLDTLANSTSKVRFTLHLASLAAPEEVVGQLRVKGFDYRIDIFAVASSEDCISILKVGEDRTWKKAKAVRWHTASNGMRMPLEDYIQALEKDGEFEDLVAQLESDLLTLKLFNMRQALARAKDAVMKTYEEGEDSKLCYATNYEDGIKFVYYVDVVDGKVKYRIKQVQDEDVVTEEKPCRITLTLEDCQKNTVDESTLSAPTFGHEMATSPCISDEEGELPLQQQLQAEDSLIGCGRLSGRVEMDDELAVPFDQFWGEFLDDDDPFPFVKKKNGSQLP